MCAECRQLIQTAAARETDRRKVNIDVATEQDFKPPSQPERWERKLSFLVPHFWILD